MKKSILVALKEHFKFQLLKSTKLTKPNKKNKIFNFFLNQSDSNFIHIPKGYANGSMSLEENSELLIFSTSSIQESLNDDIRYEANYWNPWDIKHR